MAYGGTGYGGGYHQHFGPAGYYPQHPWATIVLVFGILGLVLGLSTLIGFLLSPVAWIMGQIARKKVRAGEYAPSGALTAGWILGIIGSVFCVLMIGCVTWFVVVVAQATQQQQTAVTWMPAETEANAIRQQLIGHRIRHNGQLPGVVEGPISQSAGAIKYDMQALEAVYNFDPDDFVITNLDTVAGTFTIEVRGTAFNSPNGTYTVDDAGVTTGGSSGN